MFSNLFGDGRVGGILAVVIGLCLFGLVIIYVWRAFGRGIRPAAPRGARQPRLRRAFRSGIGIARWFAAQTGRSARETARGRKSRREGLPQCQERRAKTRFEMNGRRFAGSKIA